MYSNADLDPLIDLLIASGNSLAHPLQRWKDEPAGDVCYLSYGIDFDLLRRHALPRHVLLSERENKISCSITGATVYGGLKNWDLP